MTNVVKSVSINGQVVPFGGGGGSEGAEVVYLTQAEYDALPASKLTDGKIYKIKTSGTTPGTNQYVDSMIRYLSWDPIETYTLTNNTTTSGDGDYNIPANASLIHIYSTKTSGKYNTAVYTIEEIKNNLNGISADAIQGNDEVQIGYINNKIHLHVNYYEASCIIKFF